MAWAADIRLADFRLEADMREQYGVEMPLRRVARDCAGATLGEECQRLPSQKGIL
jgi:hypothetical protein